MADDTDSVNRRALAIGKAIAKAGAGDKAAARRMDDAGAPIFWRLAAAHRIGRAEERRWCLYVKCIALLTSAARTDSIHDAQRPLGAVLADGGDRTGHLDRPFLSELRLARLLAARGPARLAALERAVRALARQRPKLDVTSLAWAILNDDPGAVARDYYRRLDRAASPIEETYNA